MTTQVQHQQSQLLVVEQRLARFQAYRKMSKVIAHIKQENVKQQQDKVCCRR